MIRSLFTGVTGLKQHQLRMDVLSNNIANVNTTAFKRGRVMFQDLLSETLRHGQQAFGEYGGLNPMQVGHGVKTASIDTLMDQGIIEQTGKQTDIAIEGAGFFSVSDYNGAVYYTRDGNLNINPNYDLVMANTGFKLQGWHATHNPEIASYEVQETNVIPYDLNLTDYLKMYANKTSNIDYACNLDVNSQARDVQMGLDTLTFYDNQGNEQHLEFKFQKLDTQNWLWTAVDNTEGVVATGTIETDIHGNVIKTEVEPPGANSSDANPYFTYDPDGPPLPPSSTIPINAAANSGNGISSQVETSGQEVLDETITIVFDGGDPARATAYRVIGSERGTIGAGSLGGTQARIKGDPTTFGAAWTPGAVTTFDINDNQFVPPRTASITFDGGDTYSTSEIVATVNQAIKSNGLRANFYYDSTTKEFQLISNEPGSNRQLEISNTTGDIADLGLSDQVADGTGGAKPEIFADSNLADARSVNWDPAADTWEPGEDVQFTVTDRHGHSALIVFNNEVAGETMVYSKGAILSEINSRLVMNNVDATASFVDTNNDGVADQLVITGNRSGSGEQIALSGDNSMETLGLTAGTTMGTAATSEFDAGGLNFTLTEGNNPWKPNENMAFNTTAGKGKADSVNIFVPNPVDERLVFATEVDGERYEITGAVSQGAKHSTNIVIYDSVGGKHELKTTWEHTNSSTQEWQYRIELHEDNSEVQAWLRNPDNNVLDRNNPTEEDLKRANDALLSNRMGVVYFKDSGEIDLGKSFVPDIGFKPQGSSELTISLGKDMVTQFDSPFSTKSTFQDGYEMGLMEHIYFEQDGIIRGVYTNGQRQPIAQVAVTTFNNPAGLEKKGNNLYDRSPNSGLPIVGRPSEQDRGVITPAALEMSNVDLSEEFTNMIITQRAFQANSRVITTSDEMLQEVVNLKR